MSNRGPVRIERDERGRQVLGRGSGGLVTALRALVSRHEVTWIASATSEEEREFAAAGAHGRGVLDGAPFDLRLIAHDPRAYELYYNVVANPTLWFLQHGLWDLLRTPSADLRGAWREGYCAINHNFAEAVVAELAAAAEADVLFQDYHLYLAAGLVRERVPEALLSQFVHIPWVGPEQWAVLPVDIARSIHEGLLANDVIGFHTERWRAAFIDSCRALLGEGASERALVTVSPISVDPGEFDRLAASSEVRRRETELVRSRPEQLIVRVDRTDPTKNVVRGFEAYSRLLERRPDLHGRIGMLALLDPSRQTIREYQDYSDAIEASARDVNERFGRPGWEPLQLDVRDDFALSVAAYKQFDVLLVNPVMDGMNLVAKEAPLVNRRGGVVVLSREAGAFAELGPWVVPVDPYDVDGQASALEEALELPSHDRRQRLAAIDAWVRAHDVDAWARAQLGALDEASSMRAKLRQAKLRQSDEHR